MNELNEQLDKMKSNRSKTYLLSDWHGEFCAFCLHPFKEKERIQYANFAMELHHVFPKAGIKSLVFGQFPRGWTVPTHFYCHRYWFQRISDSISGTHLLLRIPKVNVLDFFARAQHDRGDYWGATITKLAEIEKTAIEDEEKRAILTRHALASASGIKTKKLPGVLKTHVEKHQYDPGVLFQLANFYAVRGKMGIGTHIYSQAIGVYEKAGKRKREEELSNFAVRRLIFNPSNKNAKEAQIITKSNSYTNSTSLILTSSLLFNSDPVLSNIALEELNNDYRSQSWLYISELLFLKACRQLADQKRENPIVTESIYENLMQSEYIRCMMGHNGIPHPSLPFFGHRNLSIITPGEVLRELPRPKEMNPAKCLELRKNAIEQNELFFKIMVTLRGSIDFINSIS